MDRKKALGRLAFVGLMGSSVTCMAGYQNHSPGPLMTLGKTTNPSTLLSVTGNPAGGELLLSKGEKFRMGYFSSFGVDLEVGDVDNFLDEVDELSDDLDDDDISLDDAQKTQRKFEELLPIMGDSARVTLGVGIHSPLAPAAIRSSLLEGVLTFDLQASGLFDIQFLDAPIVIDSSGAEPNLTTASSLYIKGGSMITGSIGYSREVWQQDIFDIDSKFFAGIQANIYNVSLTKQVMSLENLDGDDASDAAQDEFDDNQETSTNVGIDIGAIWSMPYGQVGVTFANINEPEFDYGTIGTKCGSISDKTRKLNCVVAQQTFADEIDFSETAVMNAQMTVEGAVFSKNKQWLVSSALDMNSTYDLVGRETQYFNLSASYFPNSYLIPAVRFGVNQNLKGSELTMLNFGTTLFGVMNIDLSASTDSTEVDGSSTPRRIGFNIGFEEKF